MNNSNQQLGIRFAPSFLSEYPHVLDFIADWSRERTQRPVKTIAADMDMGRSELSKKLHRHDRTVFSLDDFQTYLKASGDILPLIYLIAENMGDFDPDQLRQTVNDFIEQWEREQ